MVVLITNTLFLKSMSRSGLSSLCIHVLAWMKGLSKGVLGILSFALSLSPYSRIVRRFYNRVVLCLNKKLPVPTLDSNRLQLGRLFLPAPNGLVKTLFEGSFSEGIVNLSLEWG